MKKIWMVCAALMITLSAFAQQKTLPVVNLKTTDGKTVSTKELATPGKITVVSFWATWCSPCKKELDAIMDYYPEWQSKYNMQLVAISVDDARTAAKIPSMVEEKGWEYSILIDSSKELQQALGVASVPFTLLIDQNGNVVFEHNGYAPGDELELEEKLKELSK
ncbi:MAG: TlpA family protein disulfide reductase [Chitinophagales bacterium]|jgi:cytochrome c biogenesis protein CcmG, thiol:disulfide interchange protein DsbE|nr:TlpA family protein disulfide reductase [Chitinophagales bacterium]